MKSSVLRSFFVVGVLFLCFVYLFFYFYSDSSRLVPLFELTLVDFFWLMCVSFLVFFGLSLQQYFVLASVGCYLSLSNAFFLSVGNSLLNYLPLRAGVFAKGGYLKLACQLSIKKYVVTLVSAQLLWVLLSALVGVTVGVSLVLLYKSMATLTFIILIISLALSFLLSAFVLFCFPYVRSLKFMRFTYRFFKYDSLSLDFCSVDKKNFGLYLMVSGMLLFFFSLRIWYCFYVIDVEFSFLFSLFLQSCLAVGFAISFIPGNLGVKEGAFVGICMLLGVDLDGALIAALIDRAVSLLFTFVVGPVALVKLSVSVLRGKPSSAEPF